MTQPFIFTKISKCLNIENENRMAADQWKKNTVVMCRTVSQPWMLIFDLYN